MTLEEAIARKEELPESYEYAGALLRVIVSPSEQDDLIRMYGGSPLNAIYERSERLAPMYSSNNDYLVIGFCERNGDVFTDSTLRGLANN